MRFQIYRVNRDWGIDRRKQLRSSRAAKQFLRLDLALKRIIWIGSITNLPENRENVLNGTQSILGKLELSSWERNSDFARVLQVDSDQVHWVRTGLGIWEIIKFQFQDFGSRLANFLLDRMPSKILNRDSVISTSYELQGALDICVANEFSEVFFLWRMPSPPSRLEGRSSSFRGWTFKIHEPSLHLTWTSEDKWTPT